MSNIVYDKSHFIKKFSAIPDERWIDCGLFHWNGKSCALGHCGMNYESFFCQENYPEAHALVNLLRNIGNPTCINDGKCFNYNQSTPKARILAALADLPD